MNNRKMSEWLLGRLVICSISNYRHILHLDNYSGDLGTDKLFSAFSNINTKINYFPLNPTYLIRPCESSIIQNNLKEGGEIIGQPTGRIQISRGQ